MALSIFADKANMPNDEMVQGALKDNAPVWNSFYNFLKEKSGGSGTWKMYSKGAGWTFQIKNKKARTLLYLIPQDGYFKVGFVFGEKAAEEVLDSSLPEDIKAELRAATKYVEGRSVMFDVRTGRDIENMKTMLDIKERN